MPSAPLRCGCAQLTVVLQRTRVPYHWLSEREARQTEPCILSAADPGNCLPAQSRFQKIDAVESGNGRTCEHHRCTLQSDCLAHTCLTTTNLRFPHLVRLQMSSAAIDGGAEP